MRHCVDPGAWTLRMNLLVALLLVCLTPAYSQTTWFKYEGNPVLDVGPPGSWDAGGVLGQTVVRVRDTLKTWYTGSSPTNKASIGYAWSTDGGLTWRRYRSNPVITPTQKWDSGWCFSPYVIYADSLYRIWYSGNDGDGHIGYADSRDGIRWRRSDRNPVLRHGPSRWDAPRIEWPSVLGPDSAGRFKMWYCGWSQGFQSSGMGYATAVDETTWAKQDHLNPVLAPTVGSWDAPFLRFGRVLFDGRRYEMWYSGGSHFFGNQQIGYATSLDGTTWRKYDTPVLRPGRPDPWDANAAASPEVIFDGAFYHMWYGGHDGAKGSIGYAVSPKGSIIEISPSHRFLTPAKDTVHIKATVERGILASKAGSHLEFSAKIQAAQPHYENPLEVIGVNVFDSVTTIRLYDDGSHGDGLTGDGLFANQWVPPKERLYVVDLKMKLDQEGTRRFKIDHAGLFTTIGPVTLEGVQFLNDSTAYPGDTVVVKLTLRNHGDSTAAPAVRASLSTDNASMITITESSPNYWEIPAGGTSLTEGYYRILINPYFSSEARAQVKVTISCWTIPLWYDSFTFRIVLPWWKTWWAYGGYLVLGAGIFLGGYRYNLKRMKARNELKMKAFEAEQLHSVDRMKSRFFANISHEFRTPLTLIEGPLIQLKSRAFEGNVREQYDLMLRSTRSLTRLVNQLLDLSKLEAGQMKLRAQYLDICQLIRGAAAAFESLAARKEIEYRVEVPSQPIRGWFDTDAVEKIVGNLLSNALKFTSKGGTVKVAVGLAATTRATLPGEGERGNEAVVITVSDTGIGIPAAEVSKIFDRFYQIDASQNREHAGTGIGLSLVKDLTELHHGHITVKSEESCGSTFTVTLPLGNEHLKPEEIVQAEAPEADHLSGRLPAEESISRVPPPPFEDLDEHLPLMLIVEDNEDMRIYMRGHFSREYRFLEAVNGAQGFSQAIDTVPDLIVSDVMMPEMDGFTLCAKLKQDERTSHIPVILLTARADASDRISGLETGADDYVTKPFDARELLVRARNLIEGRKKLRERFQRAGIVALDEVAVTSVDKQFLAKVMSAIEKHLSDSSFTADQLASELYVSRMQLHRKMRALTDLSPWHFVRKVRLHRAAQLLRKHAGNVAEVAFQVGYESPSRFGEAFREEFGHSPSEFESPCNS